MKEHGYFQITQKAFIRKNNFLLVMKDKKSGEGDLPGGRMNQDEFFGDWLVSLNRELQEELGNNLQLKIYPEVILVHKHFINLGKHPCIILGYHADFLGGEIQISEEHEYYEWVDIKTYKPELLFSEYMLDAVKLYLKNYG